VQYKHNQEIDMASSFIALSDNNVLVSFNSSNLSRVSSTPVTGIDGSLLGIDIRPANGLIYGITTANKIYTIAPTTGIATQVSTLNTPFTATSVSGFDFNPAADRLRLVGDNDQNFRINVDTGAVTVDGNLAFAAGDVNAGDDPSITAAAYTNSFAGTAATQLYDIDAAQDILVLQNPPNNGTLATIGSLGVDFGPLSGFDIVSSSLGNNTAFATSTGKLYSIDLGTGAATNLGTIGSGSSQLFKGLIAAPAPDIDPIAVDSQFLGLTNDNQLLSFNPSSPNRTTTIPIVGIDAPLLGIDTRPANGLIYGITTANTIYTINPNTGTATKVSTLNTPFTATSVSGFDFNPAADRLRLVGDNDQNFRINVDTGAVTVDGNLAFAAGDVNASSNPTVTAAAYTNAIASPASTQLYDIDTNLDVLTLQNPPNNGTLTTVGKLGVDLGTLAGFDIVSTSDGKNAAFAVSNSTLYGIDLLTGQATNVGAIVSSSTDTSKLQGLTTVNRSKIVDPIATNSRFIALSNANTLASFNPGNPSAVRSIAVTGLKSGETLLGIDTRPANGLIYGLTTASNLYTLDPNSGAASLVSTLNQPFTGTSVVGFDFNPVADRLRLVGDNDQNFRINVDTGAVTADGNLAFAAGDVNDSSNPTVTAVAYTNAIASPTSTQLYDIDTTLDVLTLQNPPNNGTLTTVGALGIDFGTLSGFDIISTAEGTNAAFAVSNSTLYSINLQTGAASSLGAIGGGNTYQGLATVANAIVTPTAVSLNANNAGLVSSVAYDITGANRVAVDLGNNPSVASSAAFDNFVGLYEVADSLGGIDTNGDGIVELIPGDAAYARTAIGNRVNNFTIRTGGNVSNDTTPTNFGNVFLTGGKFYVPFVIANLGNSTPADFLAKNPTNQAATKIDDQVAYFGITSANPDRVSHLRSLGNNTFGFEDLPGNLGISDNDFNDAVFQINFKVV
jgi:trimeric autotransporter adhesin